MDSLLNYIYHSIQNIFDCPAHDEQEGEKKCSMEWHIQYDGLSAALPFTYVTMPKDPLQHLSGLLLTSPG